MRTTENQRTNVKKLKEERQRKTTFEPAASCAALPTHLNLSQVPPLAMNRSAASRIPRCHFPAFFAAVDHSAVSTPNTKGASSVDPKAARNSLRSWTMRLCQVFNCPPGLGFSPSAIVPGITRRTLPAWVIARFFAVPRPPQRRAAVYDWSFRCSRNVSS